VHNKVYRKVDVSVHLVQNQKQQAFASSREPCMPAGKTESQNCTGHEIMKAKLYLYAPTGSKNAVMLHNFSKLQYLQIHSFLTAARGHYNNFYHQLHNASKVMAIFLHFDRVTERYISTMNVLKWGPECRFD